MRNIVKKANNMKTLNDLSPDERRVLAKKIGCNAMYLWQCGAGLRTPSLRLAQKLIKADKRLTMAGLLAPWKARMKKQEQEQEQKHI